MSIDEIKQRLDGWPGYHSNEYEGGEDTAQMRQDITFLLAEVERLQVEVQVRDSLLGPVIDDTLKGGE